MAEYRVGRFPAHLAELVARQLTGIGVAVPSDSLLLQLFETLYFASLKTDETRPCRCTINFLDPSTIEGPLSQEPISNGWNVVPFRQRIPLTVRSLLKLADAADPTVSSLAVCHDEKGGLFIWGMVDQEIRYGDYVSLNGTSDPIRAGLFQATITGVGAVSAYKNFTLLGSLEQDNLIADYHDVLWDGPVFEQLSHNLEATLLDKLAPQKGQVALAHLAQVKDDLQIRWQNAICRMLYHIQQYGHGGGLLITPQCPARDVNVKYEVTYDRLPSALLRLAQHHILLRQTAKSVAAYSRLPNNALPRDIHFAAVESQQKLDLLKNELLGCVHFIASLSSVDGFVLLDRSLVVHGFGVEARADADLTEVDVAGDSAASPHLLRKAPLSQFGTRHRAMLRYCNEHPGALGFVISQDGDIRATMKHQSRLILWENINVQLAYRAENRGELIRNFSPTTITRLFGHWVNTVKSSRSD